MWSLFIPLEIFCGWLAKKVSWRRRRWYLWKIHSLKQKGFVSEYTNEWEVLAIRQRGFIDDELLKMFRCGLKEYIRVELYKPKTIEEARHVAKIIEQKHKFNKSYTMSEKSSNYSKGKSSKNSLDKYSRYISPPLRGGNSQVLRR